ncbi:MAG TPA: glyoxalase, partial [Planctomycetaceae bacterium]|nr:glyoxalase [Planctomycetaceae bacterium]
MKVHGVLETAIYVDDLQLAIDFYQRLFEFEIMAEDQRV